jgi:hypothetical protein
MSETPTDPEISGILKHLQHKPQAEQAWPALQQYRAEALGPLPADLSLLQSNRGNHRISSANGLACSIQVPGDAPGEFGRSLVEW